MDIFVNRCTASFMLTTLAGRIGTAVLFGTEMMEVNDVIWNDETVTARTKEMFMTVIRGSHTMLGSSRS